MTHHHRKTRQLCAAIERTLQSSLACDVEDPALDDVALDRVEAVDNAFVAVFMTRTLSLSALADLQAHLDDAAPIFREAMARELTRKRVPTVMSVIVPFVSALDSVVAGSAARGAGEEHRSNDGASDR